MAHPKKTFLAFVVGPLAPCVLTGVGQAFTQHVHEQMTWLSSFLGYTLFAIPAAFLLSYSVGTLVFLILRYTRKEYVAGYCAGAILAGFSFGAIAAAPGQRIVAGATMAALATSAAIVFAIVRGPDRRISQARN